MVRRILSVLSVVALSVVSTVQAHSTSSSVEPGAIPLALSPSPPSYLIENVAALETSLCGTVNQGHAGGAIVVSGDGGGNRMALSLEVLEHEHLIGWTALTVRPRRLFLTGPSKVLTSCGSWTYDLVLRAASDVPHPVSQLVLVPDPDRPEIGTASGQVQVAAEYEFTHATTAVRVQVARDLVLNLSGVWSLAPASRMPLGESNLILLGAPTDSGWSAARGLVRESAGGELWFESGSSILGKAGSSLDP